MKKTLSVLLCFLLLISVFSLSAAAVTVSAGDDALRAQFELMMKRQWDGSVS